VHLQPARAWTCAFTCTRMELAWHLHADALAPACTPAHPEALPRSHKPPLRPAVGNFGTVFVDQSYWQGAIAAKPSATYRGCARAAAAQTWRGLPDTRPPWSCPGLRRSVSPPPPPPAPTAATFWAASAGSPSPSPWPRAWAWARAP
jgi:hypothetical protein